MEYLKTEETIAQLVSFFGEKGHDGLGYATDTQQLLIYNYEPPQLFGLKFTAESEQTVTLNVPREIAEQYYTDGGSHNMKMWYYSNNDSQAKQNVEFDGDGNGRYHLYPEIVFGKGTANESIYLCGDNHLGALASSAISSTNDKFSYFVFGNPNVQTKVEGSIFALISASENDNPYIWPSYTSFSTERTFQGLFKNCAALTDASDLLLSATGLSSYCYYGMFSGCTSLTTAPTLPATTLAPNCYLAMFSGCTNLNYVKCLATDISASNCVKFWLTNVAASGTFVKAASMSDWPSGNNGIPNNWTVQDA